MKTQLTPSSRRGEQGIALVIALFMMLAMSVLGTSLMFVSKTETLSSHNYRLMSEARYGAESGIHVAANYLMSNDYLAVMPGTGADPMNGTDFANYDTTTSPVKLKAGGKPVVLTSVLASSNYPINGPKAAFVALFSGATLDTNDAPVSYKATATLMSMRRFYDEMSKGDVTIQTWEIVGEGSIDGVRQATVEVSSLIERQSTPIYAYAAFSVDNGCASMRFGGGGNTDSFNSGDPLGASNKPVTAAYDGDVGTNGNLDASGSSATIINGTLSTPRTGVGTCSSSNVTAESLSGQASVKSGLVQLSQALDYPAPPLPSTLPPTNIDVKFQSTCTGIAGCSDQTLIGLTIGKDAAGNDIKITQAMIDLIKTNATNNGKPIDLTKPQMILDPLSTADKTVVLSNVEVNANSTLFLRAGNYVFNSFKMNGGSQIVVIPDANGNTQVSLDVIGTGQSTPITITGNGLLNTTFQPSDLKIRYAGNGEIKLAGGDNTAALIYAPKATGTFTGGSDLYGAVVVNKLTDMGSAAIHYDRALKNNALHAGNYVLSAFTWKNY